MALSIRNAKAKKLARELAAESGEKNEKGVRSLKLTNYRFVPGFDEIVSSIYDLI